MATKQRIRTSLGRLWKDNSAYLLTIICPDNNTISKVYSIRDSIHTVTADVCKDLEINEPELFGMALYKHNEYHFISRKKSLQKVLMKESIVTKERALQICEIDESRFLEQQIIKACRLYLRVHHFYVSFRQLSGNCLYYYYEQTKLDTIKSQNLLNLEGFNTIFHSMAAKSIWLKYGSDSIKVISGGSIALHVYLPQFEIGSSTKNMLIDELTGIISQQKNNAATTSKGGTQGSHSYGRCETASLPVNDQSKIHENCPALINTSKVNMMFSFIRESIKLPFYGVHHYQVTYINENTPQAHVTCKLGIGPRGILACITTDLTTWEILKDFKWISILDTNYIKNDLYLYELNVEDQIHQFQCIDEKEAKYLCRQIKEMAQFQKHISTTAKDNSIGVSQVEQQSKFLTSNTTRSMSLTLLRSPRIKHLSKINETADMTKATCHSQKRHSVDCKLLRKNHDEFENQSRRKSNGNYNDKNNNDIDHVNEKLSDENQSVIKLQNEIVVVDLTEEVIF